MGWVANPTPRPLYLKERVLVPVVEETMWEGPRTGLVGYGEEKNLWRTTEFEPQTVKPVANRYSTL